MNRKIKKFISVVVALGLASMIFIPPAQAEVVKANLTILGMSCSMCAYGLHKKLSALEEIEKATIDFKTETGILTFKPEARIDYERIEKAVTEGGYTLKDMSVKAIGRLEKKKNSFFFIISKTGQRLPLKTNKESCPRVEKEISEGISTSKSNLREVSGKFIKLTKPTKENKPGLYFNITSCKTIKKK